jgi:short-subunit dehydrogenase
MVIGASEGLGAEWATLLCQNGMNVITVARRANETTQSQSQWQAQSQKDGSDHHVLQSW